MTKPTTCIPCQCNAATGFAQDLISYRTSVLIVLCAILEATQSGGSTPVEEYNVYENVNVGTAADEVLPSFNTRQWVEFKNMGATNIIIGVDNSVSTNGPRILTPGEVWEPSPIYKGSYWAIGLDEDEGTSLSVIEL